MTVRSAPYTSEEDAYLSEAWARGDKIHEIAAALGRNDGSVHHRAVYRLKLPSRPMASFAMLNDEKISSEGALRKQDEAFQLAMIRAVEKGKEKPPMMGVDRRPCTCNPKMYALDSPIRGSSAAAACVDIA